MRRRSVFLTLAFLLFMWSALTTLPAARAVSQVAVLTQHNDTMRTGANLNETVLTTANVGPNQFGKLFTRPVNGSLYAQPLYLPGVTIPGKGTRNVVYVATMHNMVYAFDADDPNAATPLWFRTLEPSVPLPDPIIGSACGTYKDIDGEIGIISTPVIDPATNTIYVVTTTSQNGYAHWLHALDLLTGAEKAGSPVNIQASVAGRGNGSVGGVLTFQSQYQIQRSSLLLANGSLYLAFASYCDTGPYHGWVMQYDAANLAQRSVFVTTPDGSESGIWMAGQGPATDASGDLFVMTGNGSFSANSGGRDYSSSVLRLHPGSNALSVVDWFTPFNEAQLSSNDRDLGSSGPLLIPGTNLLVGGGKEGKLYLLNRDNLGRFQTGSDSQIVQSFPASSGHIHGSPVFWNSPSGPLIYVWGEDDYLKAFRMSNGLFVTTPFLQSGFPAPGGMPGGMLSISANGSTPNSGILWASIPVVGDANQNIVPGVVRAFDAANLSTELWNSQQNAARDSLANFAKFSAPTVANGKVYMGTFSNQLVVYGPLPANLINQALNKATTSSTPCASFEASDKAVDGTVINNSKWCSNAAGPLWLQVDLGTTSTVSSVVLHHAGDGNETAAWNTRDFTLQTSVDGNTWTTVATVLGNTEAVTTHSFAAVSARYIKLNVITPTSDANPAARIFEFEVYGSALGGPSATPTATNVVSPTDLPTVAPTSTQTNTPSSTATSTPTSVATSTATSVATSTATSTPSSIATNTPASTPTSVATSTATSTPSSIATSILTSVATSTATSVATSTATSTPSSSATNTPTSTPTSVATSTATSVATNTPSSIATSTLTSVATSTATSVATSTATSMPSSSATNTPTSTLTSVATSTATRTATNTPTRTVTNTPTRTATNTPTRTATNTPTRTAISTATVTPTPSANTNLALNKQASGSTPCSSGEGAAQAVDGLLTSKWCSLVSGNKLLQVDLGAATSVSRVVVRHAEAGNEAGAWNTRDFTVQTSIDSITWTTVATVTGNTAATTTHTFTARSARYVRLNITTPTSDGNPAARIHELEVYNGVAVAPVNLALNKQASGSTPCGSGEGAAQAVDGLLTSKWCSLVSGSKLLQVDLGAATSMSRVVVRHAEAGNEAGAWNTRDFTVQTSTDGTNWVTVATVSGNTAATTTHTFTARSARYVRLNITTPTSDGNPAARIYELEVYAS